MKCRSCNKPFDEHLGIQAICEHSIKLQKIIDSLWAIINSMNAISKHQTSRVFSKQYSYFNRVHPLTCGKNSDHGSLYPLYEEGKVKLVCPDCDYIQDNAAMFSVETNLR